MNRYSNRRGNIVVPSQRGGSRLAGIVAALLAVALIVLLFFAVPAMRYRAESRSLFIGRMLTEVEAAQKQVVNLSRTASNSSFSTLSAIRSEVYAADLLNQTERSLSGRELVSSSLFDALYATIDNYTAKIISGTTTGELQTELTQELDMLKTAVSAIE